MCVCVVIDVWGGTGGGDLLQCNLIKSYNKGLQVFIMFEIGIIYLSIRPFVYHFILLVVMVDLESIPGMLDVTMHMTDGVEKLFLTRHFMSRFIVSSFSLLSSCAVLSHLYHNNEKNNAPEV